ncbi:lys-63-specific deubiquitinase BRCC36-like isoform X1 [Limulus polyphemus]|uniref:Lys-63-specific deubiquitinase BRCC36-like isoform X1 n=1 Tax=Limulus polyphemus TaxID=6850 RepID=A0ABM1BMD6_LIMPO|nr:lys-63-specific deubiquitinase BRCC36-like isoform X1 [Limulus polyphemus]
MATSCVKLSADVYLVCLNHALSTEREEVMGLLIGEIDQKRVSHISAVIMLRRSDKRKDRVEISPEQLSDASTQAERLARTCGRPVRVLGWYHSHPHITVWPSHVDVQTQAMYQMMDDGFVGLIFSVFSEEASTKQGRIQVTCFQSINQSPEGEPPQYMRLEIPLHIVPSPRLSGPCLETLVQLPQILCQEELEAYSWTHQISDLDLLTRLHNGAVYTKSLCHIAEVVGGPLLQVLESRLSENKRKMMLLQKEREQLEQELKQLSTESS